MMLDEEETLTQHGIVLRPVDPNSEEFTCVVRLLNGKDERERGVLVDTLLEIEAERERQEATAVTQYKAATLRKAPTRT